MGKVISSASMSLDGYIAKDDNTIGHLFDWFDNGELEYRTINPDITLHLNQASFDYWQTWVTAIGALICGRTLFDFTDGWDGRHTMDVPVVVVTHEPPTDWIAAHPDAPFDFVSNGVEAAVARAQEIAGDRTVAVAAGTIARQCFDLGLLDAVAMDLVPVVMGGGRPYFGELDPGDVPLGDPTTCIPSDRVIHLVYPVERG
jgi:dihydrofolate reductase